MKNEYLICDLCGRLGARVKRLSKSYGKGADLLVIENVPVVSCPHCGESFLTAKPLRGLENIKNNRKSIAIERPVQVAVFAW